MNLIIAIYSSYDESPESFVEATSLHSGLQFETIMSGGFGVGSFTVHVGGWNAVRWYRDYLGYHVVIFDHLGRRVYEGYIDNTDAAANGVKVNIVGYYAHSNDLFHGIIYPASTAKSISEIVTETVQLATKWSTDVTQIKVTTTNVAPQDFTGEAKLKDAIEAVLKFGDDGINPVPLYFAIWENRRAYLIAEPLVSDEPDWQVRTADFIDSSGLSLSRSRKDLFNKIQVLYDDPYIGATFTGWFEDLTSQKLFGTREGSLNIGAAFEDIALVMGALAINSYARPTQSSTLGVAGSVYNKAGGRDYPYMIRAGQQLRVNDYDATVSQLVDGGGGADSAMAFISRTQYNADKNSVSLEIGRKNLAMDILMARLGMSSAAVR